MPKLSLPVLIQQESVVVPSRKHELLMEDRNHVDSVAQLVERRHRQYIDVLLKPSLK